MSRTLSEKIVASVGTGEDPAELEDIAAAEVIIAALPTADPGDGVTVWNDAGVLKVATGP